MNCIGIYLNVDKDDAPELAGQVFQWLHNKGISVYVPQDQSKYLSLSIPGLQWEEYIRLVQMVIVLGGDGTLLAATRKLSPAGVPVFGVNLGHLGFLTSVEPSNLFEILTEILAEEYEIEQRMMLIAKVNRKGSNVYQYLALNEVVVTKSAFSRIIRLQTFIENEYFATYPGDGLIIATPTGSTAYSLSAGGPIINPQLQNIVITPICPHTLSFRSLVVPEHEVVKIMVKSDHRDVMLTCDGQVGFQLQPDDQVVVSSAPFKAKLIRVKGHNFYRVLRTRLHDGTIA